MTTIEKYIKLSNYDLELNSNKYSIDILEKNIMNLDLIQILHTQHLTPDFCMKYILSGEYASSDAERYLMYADVMEHQKHITKADLLQARLEYFNQKNEPEK